MILCGTSFFSTWETIFLPVVGISAGGISDAGGISVAGTWKY